jgi:uncharacterized protein YkwD
MTKMTKMWMTAMVASLVVGCGLVEQDPLAPADEAEQTRGVEDGPTTTEDEPTGAESPADDDVDELVILDDPRQIGADQAVEPSADQAGEPEASAVQVEAYTSSAHAAEEAEFLDELNDERTARGLAPLKVFWELQAAGRLHSETMASQNDLHHNPDLASVTRSEYWRRLGENVGRGHSVPSLHDAFMDSPGHRDNILGDYTHVGIGVTKSGSTIWVTAVFMKAAVSGLENTSGPFVDDNFNTHETNIHKIYEAGITHGCGGGDRPRYCPDGHVTRGQMAAFLDRALGLPDTDQNYFTDTQGTFYEVHANRLRAAGITYGCASDRYCGEDDVTRGQMAAFLDRALNLPDTDQNYFTDTQGTYYEDHANRLRAAGITHGCGNGKYCGEQPVTRAQMASFLARALGL